MITNIKIFKESYSNWTPVIPRDLFNSSKILKCIGKLCLLNHNNQINLSYEYDDRPFEIDFDIMNNGLYIKNIVFNNDLHFYVPYNSKQDWPLICIWNDTEYSVFEDNGQLTEEFNQLLKELENDKE